MSVFGEYLYQLIQGRGISISKLSRDSGVERTAIHKALAGGRILPYPSVRLLAYNLQLSPKESQKLHQYYSQLFETETAVRVRSMIDKIILGLSELSFPASAVQTESAVRPDSLLQKNTYKGSAEISRLLRFVIAEEMKQQEPKMELAVPAEMEMIEAYMERLYRCSLKMEVSHIICLNTSKTSDDDNLYNIECFSHVLPAGMLSNRQYHVYYYYSDISQVRYTDPLPYFLVTHAGAVCFSENCQTAIFFRGEEEAEYFRACFYHLKQLCHELLEYEEETGELWKKWKETDTGEGYCAMIPQPYARMLKQEKVTALYTRRGISEFLKTGRLYELFSEQSKVICENGRPEILMEFLEAVRSERIQGKMINDMMFPFSERYELLASLSFGMMVYDRSKNIGIRIAEQSICRMFHDWMVHFYGSDRVFDKEKTEEIIMEEIRLWQKE